MKRNRTHSTLLITALFHLLVDVAFAGEAVLCVGPNDHAAIEVGHLARDCASFQEANVGGSGPELAIGDSTDCTDIPLHTEAEMASEDLSWDPNPPSALAFCAGSGAPLTLGSELCVGQGSDLTPTMRAHRSIVLII